jgi:hypothetical protein
MDLMPVKIIPTLCLCSNYTNNLRLLLTTTDCEIRMSLDGVFMSIVAALVSPGKSFEVGAAP